MNNILRHVMENRKPKKPIHHSEKLTLVHMWVRGMTCNAIAKDTGRSPATVCRWINRWKEEGHVNARPRSGRPRQAVNRKDITKYSVSSLYEEVLKKTEN